MFSVEERVEPTLRAPGVASRVRLARVFLIVFRLPSNVVHLLFLSCHPHACKSDTIRTVESNLTTSNTEDGVNQTKSP